jgi:hypothetical protein
LLKLEVMINKIFSLVFLLMIACSVAFGQQALVTTNTGSSLMLSFRKMDRVLRSSGGSAVIVYDGNSSSYTTQGTFESFIEGAGCNLVPFTEHSTSRPMAIPLANISQVLPTSSNRCLLLAQDLLSGRVIKYEASESFESISEYILDCTAQAPNSSGIQLIGELSDTSSVTSVYPGMLVYVDSLSQYWSYGPPWTVFDTGGESVDSVYTRNDSIYYRIDGEELFVSELTAGVSEARLAENADSNIVRRVVSPSGNALPAGTYFPTLDENGNPAGTGGYTNLGNYTASSGLTTGVLPILSGSTFVNSRISHPSATRTILNSGNTLNTYFEGIGSTSLTQYHRTVSDGNFTQLLSQSSGGVNSFLEGNSSSVGGYKATSSSSMLQFTNNPSATLGLIKLRVRPQSGSYVDAMNISATGFIGIGVGGTNPRYPLHVFGTGGMGVPAGTTAERGYSERAYFRLNTDEQRYEGKTDTGFVAFVHTEDVSYAENDVLVQKSGRWTPTQKTGNRVNSYTEIQARSYNKGDVVFLAGGLYIVEDTTYLLTSPGGARNYGTTDNVTRIQTGNGKFAHLQPREGSVPISPFISSYSVLADRTSNANITLEEIELYDDTEALQRGLDFVSRKKDANFLVLDQIYLTVRDTVVIEGGVIMKGLYQGTPGYQQSPFKSRIFAHINDANRDVFQFPRTSTGGYLYNTGIQNCIIDAVSDCNALVAMYLVRTCVFEQNTLRGNYFFTVDYSIRHANYGIITRGIANTKFLNNEMQLFKKACIYFTFDWPYRNTTLSMQGNSFSASGNAIISDYTNIVSRDDVFQTLDTSAIVATNARIIIDNAYMEEVGFAGTGVAAIRAESDEQYTSIDIRGLTSSSGIDVSDTTNTIDLIYAKGYDRVNLQSMYLAGYRRLITTDSVQSLQLSEIVSLGVMKSPLIGNYEGIDPLTVVNVRNSIQEAGRVVNRQQGTYIEDSQNRDLYGYGKNWLSDTLSIENLVLMSGHENLARFSDSLFTANTPWIYNGARVTVVQNDTLFQGEAIAEKVNIIGASASLGLPITENFKKGDTYTISFYYANSNVARLGISTTGSTLSPVYKSIVQDSGDWNRYEYTFTYLQDTSVNRLNIFFDAEIGERLHMTNFQLERSGSIYDTTAGEYIKTLTDPIINTPTLTGDLHLEGNLTATNIPTFLTATATLDFGSTTASSITDLTMTVTGATEGGRVLVAPPPGATAQGSFGGSFVSAVDTVTVRFHNDGAGVYDPGSGVFTVTVLQ